MVGQYAGAARGVGLPPRSDAREATHRRRSPGRHDEPARDAEVGCGADQGLGAASCMILPSACFLFSCLTLHSSCVRSAGRLPRMQPYQTSTLTFLSLFPPIV